MSYEVLDFYHLTIIDASCCRFFPIPQGGPSVEYLTSGDFMVIDINCYNADDQIL